MDGGSYTGESPFEAYDSYVYESSPNGFYEFGGSYEFWDIDVIPNSNTIIEENYSRWPKTISGVFYIDTGLYPNAANHISGNPQTMYIHSTSFDVNELIGLDSSDFVSYPVNKTVEFHSSGMSFHWLVSGILEPDWGNSRMTLLI